MTKPTRAAFSFSPALLMAIVALSTASPHSGGQSGEPTFQTGITGSSPSGPANPTTMMNDVTVRKLILRLAEGGVPITEAENELARGAHALQAVVDAGLARRDGGWVRLALNFVSADDQRLIASKARGYGRELAELVLERRAALESAAAPLAATEDERRAVLFFLVGCVALDWDGLGYTERARYRAGATVTGPGFAYTPWMKENAPDISRRGLFWGSHNRNLGEYTFTTFGDHEALPRVAMPDLFFSLQNPFATLETPGEVAGRRLVGAYSGVILSDVASVLIAIHDGARDGERIAASSRVAPGAVTAILALLENIRFVRREAESYALRMTVLKSEAKPAAERVVSLVREAMEVWHERRYAEVQRELADLTALRQGVAYEVVYTEIWHYVFGYANLHLSESGLIANPYADGAPFPGFLPYLYANAVDVSS